MSSSGARRVVVAVAVSAALFVAGAAAPVRLGAAAPGVVVTTIARFAPDVAPEGITVTPDGSMYVSTSTLGEVWRVHPDGSTSVEIVLASVPPGSFGVIGLDSDDAGRLYATVATGEADTHGVWTWRPGGPASRIPGTEAIGFPNAITTAPDGAVYVTDSVRGAIWRAGGPDGAAQVWLSHPALTGTGATLGPNFPIGANGIAFHHNGAVYVSVTERTQIVEVPLQPDGGPGQPRVLVASEGLEGADGVAVGPDGALYVAEVSDRVLRVDLDGTIDVLATAADGLDTPSSVAFGHGELADTLFAVNFSIGELLGRTGGVGPGVVRLDGVTAAVGPVEQLFAAYLSGSSEVPPNSSPAWGWSLWRVRDGGARVTFSALLTDLHNVVGIHLHLAPDGENGPIVAPIPLVGGGHTGGPGSGPYTRVVGSLTAADLTGPLKGQPMSALLSAVESGNIYVNVHTDDGVAPAGTGPGDLPGGEVRGQLIAWS